MEQVKLREVKKTMLVCGHGDVTKFCEDHDMIVCEQYEGEIENYRGVCKVLVTNQDLSEAEYMFKKGEMLACGIELVSTKHKDSRLMKEYYALSAKRKKKNYVGRYPFGLRLVNGKITWTENGKAVVDRILKLRDLGYSLKQISEDDDVHHPDGRRLSISTVQLIIKNREKYENERF